MVYITSIMIFQTGKAEDGDTLKMEWLESLRYAFVCKPSSPWKAGV